MRMWKPSQKRKKKMRSISYKRIEKANCEGEASQNSGAQAARETIPGQNAGSATLYAKDVTGKDI